MKCTWWQFQQRSCKTQNTRRWREYVNVLASLLKWICYFCYSFLTQSDEDHSVIHWKHFCVSRLYSNRVAARIWANLNWKISQNLCHILSRGYYIMLGNFDIFDHGCGSHSCPNSPQMTSFLSLRGSNQTLTVPAPEMSVHCLPKSEPGWPRFRRFIFKISSCVNESESPWDK